VVPERSNERILDAKGAAILPTQDILNSFPHELGRNLELLEGCLQVPRDAPGWTRTQATARLILGREVSMRKPFLAMRTSTARRGISLRAAIQTQIHPGPQNSAMRRP
jgi:hypothetical protein